MSGAPSIDEATFRALQDTAGAQFVAELTATFLEEAPRMIAELRAAGERADAEAFRRTAHSLKSNGLTFGALAFAAQARALELGGLASARDPETLAALDAEFARAARQLEALVHA